MAVFEKILHLAILGAYLVAWSHLVTVSSRVDANHPGQKLYSRFGARFLTKWTYAVQTIYYLCIVLADLWSLVPVAKGANAKLRGFADVLFTTITIPVGLLVTVVFWTIFIIDRDLIFPAWMDAVIPPWVNHSIHTLNSVFPLLDMMVVNHKFSSWSFSIKVLVGYLAVYLAVLIETYVSYGVWLYPIFAKLTYPQLAGFVVSTLLLAVFFHWIGRLVCELRWGKTAYEKLKQNKTPRKVKKQ